MAQRWCDLLFAHYPVPASQLRALIPTAFELDLWDREAWIAVVPFRMEAIRPRGLFPVPVLSVTPEINVRTYVRVNGQPGVYFFSLDAASLPAVRIARRFFHLPYFHARMTVHDSGEAIEYTSERLQEEARFTGSYRPTGVAPPSRPGTIEHWLTERYCFFTQDRAGHPVRGDIRHDPWPLQPAEAEITLDTMTAPLGLRLPDTPPLLHFARRLEVVAWMPTRLSDDAAALPPLG